MRYWAIPAAILFAAAVHATELDTSACVFPDTPEVPDGETASEADMASGSAAVRAYVGDTQAGLDCLSAAEEAMGEEITDEQRAKIVETYNTGVDEMTAVVERFNEQIRIYKAR